MAKKGGNRQELHEKLRVHSHAAAYNVKKEGKENDLIDRIAQDSDFNLSKEDILKELDPNKYIGRCISQVESFNKEISDPIIEKYCDKEIKGELNV